MQQLTLEAPLNEGNEGSTLLKVPSFLTKRTVIGSSIFTFMLFVVVVSMIAVSDPGDSVNRIPSMSALQMIHDDAFEAAHHTRRFHDADAYSPGAAAGKHLVLSLGSTPVVRRGASFHVRSNKGRPALEVLDRHNATSGEPVTGGVVSMNEADVYYVTIGSAMPVGWYLLRAGNETLSFIVLFNPWLSTAQEFINEAERAEYVENEFGVTFQGSTKVQQGTYWHYDQWRGSNLLAAVNMLDSLSREARQDAALVTRHLIHYLRTDVCDGKWSGSYTTGCTDASGKPGYCCAQGDWDENWPKRCHEPWTVNSSTGYLEQFTALLAEYPEGAVAMHGVRTCQCWVFGALTNTVTRSLGLASRQTTAFNSADPGEDRAVSSFFMRAPGSPLVPIQPAAACPDWCNFKMNGLPDPNTTGCDLRSCSTEVITGTGFHKRPECEKCIPCIPCAASGQMVWNFHNWNEVFISRTNEIVENPSGNGTHIVNHTGWNVIDSTYKVGPSEKAAIMSGQDSCYDTKFIVGETNAWAKMYVYDLAAGIDPAALHDRTDLADILSEHAQFNRTGGEPLFTGRKFAGDPFGNPAASVGSLIATKKVGDVSDACKTEGDCRAEMEDITLTYKKAQPSEPAGPDMDKKVCPPINPSNGGRRLNAGASGGDSPMHNVPVPSDRTAASADRLESHGVGFSASAPGSFAPGNSFTVEVNLTSVANTTRTVSFLLLAHPIDYRGHRAVRLVGDRAEYVSVPLGGEASVRQTISVPPHGNALFKHEVFLSEDDLTGNEVTSEHWMSLVVSAVVEETGATFVAQPRLRIMWTDSSDVPGLMV